MDFFGKSLKGVFFFLEEKNRCLINLALGSHSERILRLPNLILVMVTFVVTSS